MFTEADDNPSVLIPQKGVNYIMHMNMPRRTGKNYICRSKFILYNERVQARKSEKSDRTTALEYVFIRNVPRSNLGLAIN